MIVLVGESRVRIDVVQVPLEAVALETLLEQTPLLQIADIQALDGGVHVAEEAVVAVQPDPGEPGRVDRNRVQLGVDPAGDGMGRYKPKEKKE